MNAKVKKCQHKNALAFHENSPIWCKECNKYFDTYNDVKINNPKDNNK